MERRARQLAIQNFDPVLRLHHFQEFLQIIRGDLMSEAAAAAVKHHHDLVRNGDPEFLRELFVAHVLWPRDLHLQIMIPASEGTDLVIAALDCTVADLRCIGACDATVLLRELKIFLPAQIALDAPARTFLHQVSKIVVRKFEEPVSANASWYTLEKTIDDFF